MSPKKHSGVAEPTCLLMPRAQGETLPVCDPSDPALRRSQFCSLGRVAVKDDLGEGDVVLTMQAHPTQIADRLLLGEDTAQVMSPSHFRT